MPAASAAASSVPAAATAATPRRPAAVTSAVSYRQHHHAQQKQQRDARCRLHRECHLHRRHSLQRGSGGSRKPIASRATSATSPRASSSAGPESSPASSQAVARPSRTPHSGYHYPGGDGEAPFFEGWYFKVTVPDAHGVPGDSFAWMYSVENPSAPLPVENSSASAPPPAAPSAASCPGGKKGERAGGGVPCVMMQVMGPAVERQAEWGSGEGGAGGEGGARDYVFQETADTGRFWGERHELALGTCFRPREGQVSPLGEVPPQEFERRVEHGFQVTPFLNQGILKDQHDGSIVRWQYEVTPIDGWGPRGGTQLSTAGWLAALPAFEPHWQVCMALGRATGWVEWRGHRIEFTNAVTYSEKNWGGAFPLKWFWIQCNVFSRMSLGSSIALTVAGAKRLLNLPLVANSVEEVGMVGLHWEGQFIEFVPNRGAVEWRVQPWGSWWMRAENEQYEVTVEAHTLPGDNGTPLRAPTAEGMRIFCKDSFEGRVKVELRQRYSGQLLLEAESTAAAVEVGGGPWWEAWKQRSRMNAAQSAVISLPLHLSSILPPSLQPPGL
ncbi:hypothetical protein CLOP_g22829 [Closterium sp. NIES-67]|nr:hypothetical protein CLOP_g22829 [Closterium sp. NIES-67]